MLTSACMLGCRQDAKPMEGRAGFQAILSDPSLEAVVLVLPPNIALQVRPTRPIL